MVCAPSTWCPPSAVTPVTAKVTQSQQEGREEKNKVSKSAFLVTDNSYRSEYNTQTPEFYNRRGYSMTNGLLQNHYVQQWAQGLEEERPTAIAQPLLTIGTDSQ